MACAWTCSITRWSVLSYPFATQLLLTTTAKRRPTSTASRHPSLRASAMSMLWLPKIQDAGEDYASYSFLFNGEASPCSRVWHAPQVHRSMRATTSRCLPTGCRSSTGAFWWSCSVSVSLLERWRPGVSCRPLNGASGAAPRSLRRSAAATHNGHPTRQTRRRTLYG